MMQVDMSGTVYQGTRRLQNAMAALRLHMPVLVSPRQCSAMQSAVKLSSSRSTWSVFKSTSTTHTVSMRDGMLVGCEEGLCDGCMDGCEDGFRVGCVEGFCDGCVEGMTEGMTVGCTDGWVEGTEVGCTDGLSEGCEEGCTEGWAVG